MQISEAWLREYGGHPAVGTKKLVAQLTMAGLEVDSITPVAADFSGVVIGEVLSLEQHPDADRLRVCQVAVNICSHIIGCSDNHPDADRILAGQDIGKDVVLQIVCGASNVRVGLKVPVALIGAVLPGDFKIKKSKLRGQESFGMLCSAKELGISTTAEGLLELPDDASVGRDIRDYLGLADNIIEVSLTPNRADCLSVEGLGREIAILNKTNWSIPYLNEPVHTNSQMDWSITQVEHVGVQHQDILPVVVAVPEACPRYLGRLIKNVNPKAETPLWMQERLRRSGLRSLGPLVDVTNYVLIELGQPLHAFDADKLNGKITVRYAQIDEALTLLNGQEIKLDAETLVIADDIRALAVAGVMGGNDSAVSDATQNIFLECAFFAPLQLAGKARRYGLHTDSSHRFERGVDATLQTRALERATQLIVAIAGGSAGAIIEVTTENYLPARPSLYLRKQRLQKILRSDFKDAEVVDIFQRLGMMVNSDADGWHVTPPGFRFDIAIEADLIEEIARIYGYNNLPSSSLLMRSKLGLATETLLDINRVKHLLVDRGYQEAITYSFVDEDIQRAVAPDDICIRLQNPISSELSVMRTTLWCGLLKAALYNTNRQQNRVRLFETGLRFVNQSGQTQQQKMLAGLILGSANAEQWGEKTRKVDFFDIKSDVEAIFTLLDYSVHFVPAQHPALHPGQTAAILSEKGDNIGLLGMLHPHLEKQLGFDTQVFLFEVDQELILKKQLPKFKSLSKYPSVRRDMALIVKEDVAIAALIGCIKSGNEQSLQDVVVFDIYRGKGVEEGCKSVALSLIMQNNSQTLIDSEIDAIFNRTLETLTNKLSAKLRD
ncbi:phenylalanine--tRNA ligase subunit beta [Crenothrix polyspora]|uniref:Phenylalanine--tRNA ligase beta subunit n=1 Tax=Crenothrix polyspora TaxID=360316 RepID=A0A1R4H9F0_9GAMM|nr:phenylalanine--tRNA ligase subunit beta [Crenothrix polyspora]SJM92865.1 phenylalanine tRNA synthetase, beta subunit [Crenothrix polyspora]